MVSCIDDFVRNDSTVYWTIDGKPRNATYENIIEARVDKENTCIFISQGEKFIANKVNYLSNLGEIIYSCNDITSELFFGESNKTLHLRSRIYASRLFKKYNIILVTIGQQRTNQELFGFDMTGNIVFQRKLPEGYVAGYFSILNDKPSLICDLPEVDADKYGRNRFNFRIDLMTGELSNKTLAY